MRPLAVKIESLERRQLMSVAFSAHVLKVVGSASQPNTITVGLTPDGQSVEATISYPTKKGPHVVSDTFALSKLIQWVKITSGNKSDLITIDQSNGSFPVATQIKTLNGNDTIMGGDEPDLVTLGNGIDNVSSGNGDDTLIGGRGPDTMIGGQGNDVLRAGRGHAQMIAGDGFNTFIDPFGHNTVLGGSGHDTFILKSLILDPDNNYNPAKDKFRQYTPPSTDSNNDLLDGILAAVGTYLI